MNVTVFVYAIVGIWGFNFFLHFSLTTAGFNVSWNQTFFSLLFYKICNCIIFIKHIFKTFNSQPKNQRLHIFFLYLDICMQLLLYIVYSHSEYFIYYGIHSHLFILFQNFFYISMLEAYNTMHVYGSSALKLRLSSLWFLARDFGFLTKSLALRLEKISS